MNTELILLRHGETDYNMEKKYCGHMDISLNNIGKQQASAVAKYLIKNEKIDIIYSSDLKRCMETAEEISKAAGMGLITDKALREINFGIFEGLTYHETGERFPVERKELFSNWQSYRIPGGESVEEMAGRVYDKINEIIAKNNGKKILVSTHGGCIQSAVARFICGNLDGYWRFSAGNGSITKLVINDEWTYLKYLNYIPEL